MHIFIHAIFVLQMCVRRHQSGGEGAD
jgi:hypothetical protein